MQTFAFLAALLASNGAVIASPIISKPINSTSTTSTSIPTASPATLVGSPLLQETGPLAARSYPASAVPTDYSKVVLAHHNVHRANHSASALTYSSTLAGYASTLAQSCKWGHDLSAGGGGYGQNIAAYGSSGNVAALSASAMASKAITTQWYNNEFSAFLPSYYGQATPDTSNFANWGHLTQIVWKGTTTVGCATQYCPAGTIFAKYASWYTVCDYKNAGNVKGQFGTNVGKPLGRARASE